MPISAVQTSNTFNEFRITTNSIITEVNKLSNGTGVLLVDTVTANSFIGNLVVNAEIVGDTGNDTITFPTESLTFAGGNGISSAVTGNTVTYNLETTGVSANTYGSASKVPIIVVDQYGRITSASNTNVAGVTNLQYFSANSNFVINTADGGSFAAGIGQHLGTSANVSFQDLTVTGNVTFTGNVVSVTANNLVVEDNIISLAKNNVTDAVDIGILGHYNNGANVHTGVFRDATDSTWKFFQNYPIEPAANANIDTSNGSFQFANVKAHNIEANGIFIGVGSGLTTLNASNVSSGTLSSTRLPTSGVSAGTYGSASSVPQIVVDVYGRATSVANVSIAIASGAVSGLATSATTDTSNASNITTGTLANARTTAASANGASTIVLRDGAGSFVANVITATTFSGSGASLTNVPNSATTAASANGASTIVARDASGSFTGNIITATTFSGSGASLTSIPNAATTAASANGASTIVARDASGSFTANTITATTFSGSGASLTGLNASNISTGTLDVAEGGTGLNTLTANNVMIGNGTDIILFVAPGAANNVLTSNGTNWISSAPTSESTLSDKRINPRVSTTATTSSLSPDISSFDQYNITALAESLTINAPSGTPLNGNKLLFRILDNGTTRGITWNATFTEIGSTLPTTTIANKMSYVGCIYNSDNSRWDVIAVSTQT
jgi:hypothetical protein